MKRLPIYHFWPVARVTEQRSSEDAVRSVMDELYNSEDDAVRAAVVLYSQTADSPFTADAVIIRHRYKYLIVEIVTEKNCCVAAMTFEWKERKTTIDRQLPDGTAKTVVLKTPVFKLVHCRIKH